MADEMTPGEIRRTFDRIERDHKESQKAADDRLTELARKMVPTELWQSEHRALGEDVKHLESDLREAVERTEKTSQERMTTLRGEIAVVRKAQAAHEAGHRDLGAWSRSKKLAVGAALIGASATLIAVWIAAVLAAKGVR